MGNENNTTQNAKKTFWESNTWAIVVAAIGGVITLYFEYNYFQKNTQMHEDLGITFSAMDNFLGYLFAGIFLFLVLFFILSLFAIFSSDGEGCALFVFFLFLTIISGIFITVSAQLGLKSSKKSIIIIENIYSRVQSTKHGKEITKKLDKLNIQISDEKIDYAAKLDKYINKVDSLPKLSKYISFYFFNLSEIKSYMFNNDFQLWQNKIVNISIYDDEYKGNILTYFSEQDSVFCRFYYNITNDTLDKILFFTQEIETFKKYKNSILADSCYKYKNSTRNVDEYQYNKLITMNPNSDEDEDWRIETEIRFEDIPPGFYKDVIEGKRNYYIKIRHFEVENIYSDEEFSQYRNEGRKRYLETVK